MERQDSFSTSSQGNLGADHAMLRYSMDCGGCERQSDGPLFRCCNVCAGDIRFRYAGAGAVLPAARSTMWDFFEWLPVNRREHVITLGEGWTPLLPARTKRDVRLFWKNEGINPTGSQKDRSISVAISVAHEHGFRRVVVASTGSVGVSCAAYCARAQIPCIVMVPESTPVERLRPMLAFGALVLSVRGTFEEIERILDRLDPSVWYQASTIQRRNCYQSEGPKTIAYEVFAQLGYVPDWMVVPVGGGCTLFGIWKGFEDLKRAGLTGSVPRFVGVQSRSFNLLERVYGTELERLNDFHELALDERVPTVARNLKHGAPPDATSAIRAVRSSGGRFISVTDEDALAAQVRLASEQGIFCEPSSAVVAKAVDMLLEDGVIAAGESAVAVITGSGFREIGVLAEMQPTSCSADIDEVELNRLLGGG